MAGNLARPPWWAVAVSGLCGALVAGTLVGLSTGTSGSAQGADALRPGATADADDAGVPAPRLTFLGDSWTSGSGATALRGFAVRTGEELGWEYQVLGVGGSGYTQLGGGATYAQRIDRTVQTNPDVVVVQGSLNDGASRPEVLADAALRTLTLLSEEVGRDTQVLVVGASYTPGTSDDTIDWINEAVGAAAEQADLTFVDPAEEDWTDPDDASIWADPLHPNDAGHQLIAEHLVDLLLDLQDD